MDYIELRIKFLILFCFSFQKMWSEGESANAPLEEAYNSQLNQLSFPDFIQNLFKTNQMPICKVNTQIGICMSSSLTLILCKPFGFELSDVDDEHVCSQTQKCCYYSSATKNPSALIEPNRGARLLSSTFGFQRCEFESSPGICVPSLLANSLCSSFSLKVVANGCPNPSSIFYESCCYVPSHVSPHSLHSNVSSAVNRDAITKPQAENSSLLPRDLKQVSASIQISRYGRILENTCGKMGSGSIGDNVRAYGRTSRLLGGKNTNVGSHCWHALLLKSYNRRYFCAGTLIDQDWILTAAHCVYRLDPKDIVVRLGEWDMSSVDEKPGHRDHKISQVITHPLYNSSSLENDVAVVRLKHSAQVNESNICLACLPTQPLDITETTCLVAGFGQNEDGIIVYPVLKEIDVKTIKDSICEAQLKSTGALDKNFTLKTNSFLCAAGFLQGEDVCTADGGSPMICKIEDSYYVTGIVSWGVGCGKPNVPGVYINVVNFINDIKKMIENNL